MKKEVLVGVDLGGTSFLVVATNTKGKVLAKKKRKTRAEEGASMILERLAKAVEDVVSDAGVKMKKVRAVGVGMPGPLNPATGMVLHAPNLGPTWNNMPVTEYLGEQLGRPIYLNNDVNVGAVGEHALGAGRGYESMVAIFVGTGIGGGVILNGKLHEGSRYTAGEVGHTVLVADGPLCGCGKHGCAEALASRTAIEREIRAGIASGRESLVPEIMAEMKREDMSSSVIAAALEKGDALTQEVVARAEYYMGLLVANVVNLLDPEAVVLGGGVIDRLGAGYIEPVRETAEQYYLNQQGRVHVVGSRLGDESGALGAAILASHCLKRGRKSSRS